MLNFHVDDAGISRMLLTVKTITLVVDSTSSSLAITQHVLEDDPVSTSRLLLPGAGQALESSAPSIGSNILRDPPPSLLY
jgi:hypothetical protein